VTLQHQGIDAATNEPAPLPPYSPWYRRYRQKLGLGDQPDYRRSGQLQSMIQGRVMADETSIRLLIRPVGMYSPQYLGGEAVTKRGVRELTYPLMRGTDAARLRVLARQSQGLTLNAEGFWVKGAGVVIPSPGKYWIRAHSRRGKPVSGHWTALPQIDIGPQTSAQKNLSGVYWWAWYRRIAQAEMTSQTKRTMRALRADHLATRIGQRLGGGKWSLGRRSAPWIAFSRAQLQSLSATMAQISAAEASKALQV
jgi:hypothetical protein